MEAPKLPSLFGFKSKRPNQFYIEPRYYDERKEKMKKRYDRIGRELENNPASSSNTEEFRSTLKENWGDGYARRKLNGGGMSRRVIIYLIALLAIAYYILF